MMAIGGQGDILARLRSLIPYSWFPTPAPNLDGLLSGFAALASGLYDLIGYSKLQTRIQSAKDAWLDLIAYDFFGFRISRAPSQSDSSLRTTIIYEIFRERNTRDGISRAVEDLLGVAPIIFEPANPGDTGGLDVGGIFLDTPLGGLASEDLPFQFFVTTVMPIGCGIPDVAGCNSAFGGLDTAPLMLGDEEAIKGHITYDDIYSTISHVTAAGITPWTWIGGMKHPIQFVEGNWVTPSNAATRSGDPGGLLWFFGYPGYQGPSSPTVPPEAVMNFFIPGSALVALI